MSSSSSSGSCSPRPWWTSCVVRERDLRVVVAPAQQRVARQPFEVPPVLLDVLAVVPLRAGEAEHPLLEDRVLPVPEREREAEVVADVRDPGHAVLVPAVGARAGVVVGEVVPGVAALGVVLADGAPGALAQVRAPLVPRVRGEEVVLGAAGRLGEARVLGGRCRRSAWGQSSAESSGVRSKRCQAHGLERDVEPVAEVVAAALVALAGGGVVEPPRRGRAGRPTAARRGRTRARRRGSRRRACADRRRASPRRRGSARCRCPPSRGARRAASRRCGRPGRASAPSSRS